MIDMKAEIAAYKGLKICVAVSGGRDSVALLHYLNSVKDEFGIILTALNCDHGMREESAADSRFVKDLCLKEGVKLLCFKAKRGLLKGEEEARNWRRSCYFQAVKGFDGNGVKIASEADCVATAHQLDDNAETVLFNLARGSGLAGLAGISDCEACNAAGEKLKIIRPLIGCTREQIDRYISENNLAYVDDKTNFLDEYTRNYMRINVFPTLEKVVPEAKRAIYRFSRLAAEDEKFIRDEVRRRGIFKFEGGTAFIRFCEKTLFSRAVVEALKNFDKKDYTSAHIDGLYSLKDCENGKKFEFSGLTAFKENDKIAITKQTDGEDTEVSFYEYLRRNCDIFGGQSLKFVKKGAHLTEKDGKVLRVNLSAVPESAVIRFMKTGDRFKKFKGGEKSLGDFFTDRKIPARRRKLIPLIAEGSEILAVCGVEISDKVKVSDDAKEVVYILCERNV